MSCIIFSTIGHHGRSIFGNRIISCGNKHFRFSPRRYFHSNLPINRNTKIVLTQKIVLKTNMNYFVIGVSGITCGGKTTLAKLLERSFPWCRVIHQDTYFYDDDSPHHVRMPELENHVNYEITGSLNMDQMHEDVLQVLSEPGELHYDSNFSTPNFDTGIELLKNIKDIHYDTSKYSKIPVLILEGFLMFASNTLYEKCDARFFLTLPEDECRKRRSQRSYTPEDCPGYFEKAIWPEYTKHFEEFVDKRPGIKVFDSTDPMENIWKESLDIITCRLEEMHFHHKK